ncbi:hypothetical protein HNV12_00735 [Methanococcoides sp. SA1]|nr:hypothetical protein [Methanococcoides sp. SA1]
MKRLISKKGAAHFEMIMAFTFFVGFTFFLFMTLQPTENASLFDSAVSGLQDAFFDLVNVELGSVFIKANYDGPGSCVYFDLEDDDFDFSYNGKGVFVSSLDDNEVNSGFIGGRVTVETGEVFLRVKISEEFSGPSLGGCQEVDSYETGSRVERNVVSYSKLVSMKDRYFADYEGLREDLNIPRVFDFAVVPESFGEVTMLPVNGIPETVDVLAQDKVFEVLKSDGTLVNERISFRIW